MIRAGIVGATGYTGFELVKILQRHPSVELVFNTSESNAGARLDELYASGPALKLTPVDDASLGQVDVVFLCLPHGVSAPVAVAALNAGARVIDLSADFRLRDEATYKAWYHTEHPAPELLAEAVYGLTEFVREQLPAARLVANPGCYPTSILLALQPMLSAGAINGTVIADSKSGVSGAGRAPRQHTHFVEVANNFSPYKIGRSHRHLPEIEQGFRFWQEDAPELIFSPHLLPVPRGILSTVYAPVATGWEESTISALYDEVYGDEPFVQLLPAGNLATLEHVNHSNRCALALTFAGDRLIVTAAIDNLLKGAAGQAVQNMNVMFGFEETTALC
ncbi:MAG TPA: N-acetyl-gamma-glutamyl-phosphate reductase [Candidatus Sulfomarinibacteraceae bacterium]|nr:N-acetyl-gamma-glutamyl-phosphate reductase [Candidatus Sulfomarinibacteraceae bacterium]